MQLRRLTIVEIVMILCMVMASAVALIPYCGDARGLARRLHCTSNLKQIMLAIHNYHTVWNVLPPMASVLNNDFSMKARILPFIEQIPLYNAINFSLTHDAPENATVRIVQLNVLLCPSDPRTQSAATKPESQPGFQSYPNNIGTYLNDTKGRLDGPAYVIGDAVNGKPISFADMTDGTTLTALFAESSMGSTASQHKTSQIYWSSDSDTRPIPLNILATNCGAATEVASVSKGSDWLDQSCGRGGGYSHIMTPNTKACFFGNGGFARDRTMVGASSSHPGGVNVAMADGMIRFVKDSVSPTIWRGMSTIAGGESIDPESY